MLILAAIDEQAKNARIENKNNELKNRHSFWWNQNMKDQMRGDVNERTPQKSARMWEINEVITGLR